MRSLRSIAITLFFALPLGAQEESTHMATQVRHDRILPRAECFFGLHFDLHPGADDTELGAEVTEENIAALLARVQPDFVQYDCKGHAGYTGYPTEIGWPSPGIVKDSLEVWRRVTRAYNIGLYIHYSGVWDSVAIEHNPEWGRVGPDGQRDGNNTSTFGPYADELLVPQLREVVGKYDLDGLWVDGECWAAQLDWCDAAKEQFTLETGITEIPTSPDDAHWLEWKMFHRRQFERYLGHWVDALHEFKPELQIASNWAYTTFMPKEVETNVDYLSGDYSPQVSVDRARAEARYLASTGKPWDLMMWGFNWVDGTRHSLKTAVHHCQEAGVVLMQGGGFQIYNQPVRSGYLPPFMIETLGQVADFCRARQDVSFNSTTIPQVAVLLSTESQFDRSDAVFTPYSCFDEIEGGLHALLESHYSVDLLAEHQLQPRLAEFPLVVVPDSHRLDDRFRQALIDYVADGGALLLLGARCARLFEAELGVDFTGETHGGPVELVVGEGFVSAMGPWEKVVLGDAEAAGWWHPTRDLRKDANIAATIRSLGKGRIAAVYGPIALTHFRAHHPYVRELIAGLVQELFHQPIVEVDGPPSLDIALRRTADGRLSVHLLNTSGLPLGNRSVVDYIPPVTNIALRVRVPAPPARVTLEPSGGDLSWRYDDGVVTIDVPRVEVHEVVVVE